MISFIDWLLFHKSTKNYNKKLLQEAEYQAAFYAAVGERARADAANKMLEAHQHETLAKMYRDRAQRLRDAQGEAK